MDIKVVEEIAREAMVKIEESNLNIQIVKVVKRAVFNKFEATIKNIIELELRLANLNKWVVITEILKQEVVHKLAIKVKFEATHTLAIEQAIHIVNLGMVTFLVILAIFKLLNFVSLC